MTEERNLNNPATEETVKTGVVFDANAAQRFEFTFKGNGAIYDTAHRYKALTDERYLQFLRDRNIKKTKDGTTSELSKSISALWDDLITEIENVEVEEGQDFRALIDYEEKRDSLNAYLTVIVPRLQGKRKLASAPQTEIVVVTESFFNDDPCRQIHRMKPRNMELSKEYDRIKAKQQRDETDPFGEKYTVIDPQDEAVGALYDKMRISVEGFAGDIVPLRFKTLVIETIFETALEKK